VAAMTSTGDGVDAFRRWLVELPARAKTPA
jgi:hypothetical protein